ncbi:YceI family protein [Thalassotalea ponticola]|uniref:YceI family protein n=1 Tax=Thalassotalea ponticola TaxID=1523392 RepID=UPI0025B3EFBB|nr:YceI family protein [Thalassotalea ponticola]MDN3652813.1 YceI family protein [Thalassotalea ponticola]
MITFLRSVVIATFVCTSFTALANWQLEGQQSSLSFVSIKKQDIAEVHRFDRLSGFINDDGQAQIDIALNSVNTGIDIRDTRMKQMLFNTDQFATAVVRAEVSESMLAGLTLGQVHPLTLEGHLDLHGKSQPFTAKCRVIRVDKNTLFVSTSQPVVISASDFGLSEGVTKLTEIAGLPSISNAVPVTFSLVFTR